MFELLSNPNTVLIAILAFLSGGVVKGLSGIGMPLAALPILSFGFTVPQSVVLLTMPIIISNFWQAVKGGGVLAVFKRFWLLQITIAATLLYSSQLMVVLDQKVLLLAAGSALIISVFLLSFGGEVAVPQHLERPISIVVGLASGLLGGVSSLFGIPVVLFLASLKVSKEEFITSIAVIYMFGALPYMGGLLYHGAMVPQDILASSLAVIPAMVGLSVSRHMSRNMNDAAFRKVLLVVLFIMAVSMILRGM